MKRFDLAASEEKSFENVDDDGRRRRTTTTDDARTPARLLYYIVGEPKSRILQNDQKIAPDFDMAEFLYIGRLNSA